MKLDEAVTVSAPGKIILHGEHSVVYGKLAIAASVDLRTTMTIKPAEGGSTVTLELPDLNLHRTWPCSVLLPLAKQFNVAEPSSPSEEEEAQLQALISGDGAEDEDPSASTNSLAMIAFLHLYLSIVAADGVVPPAHVAVKSNLPIGAGLGSSAAYAVCMSAALLAATKAIPKPAQGAAGIWAKEHLDLINKWAYISEKVIHGTPSGIDNGVSTYGGALSFVKGTPPDLLANMPDMRILLINTKVPRSTKQYVAGVRQRTLEHAAPMTHILTAMDSVSKDACTVYDQLAAAQAASRETDIMAAFAQIEGLIHLNQHLLNAIGVGHPALDKVCSITQAHSLATKLTGAGGGGCAFSIIPPGFEEGVLSTIKRELEDAGYTVFETLVGSKGACLD